jgi:hypothetical protein
MRNVLHALIDAPVPELIGLTIFAAACVNAIFGWY